MSRYSPSKLSKLPPCKDRPKVKHWKVPPGRVEFESIAEMHWESVYGGINVRRIHFWYPFWRKIMHIHILWRHHRQCNAGAAKFHFAVNCASTRKKRPASGFLSFHMWGIRIWHQNLDIRCPSTSFADVSLSSCVTRFTNWPRTFYHEPFG